LRGKAILGTHTRPDLDAIASLYMFRQHGNEKEKKAALLFLTGGDEILTQITGITLIDRGRGEFDHHRGGLPNSTTSASLVAEKLGLSGEKPIQQLLNLVTRSDLQGISLPFDASDIIKCLQKNNRISDEEMVEIGIRIVADTIEFRERSLPRDNLWVKDLISEFLLKQDFIPPKFQQCLESLNNPRFERPFDLVEVLVTEKTHSQCEASRFGRKLLGLEYEDSLEFFRAKKEVRKAWKKEVRGVKIIAAVSDNKKFNQAARSEGATVIVQRNSTGHTQIYFDTEKADDLLVNTLVSMIRLEELLVQGCQIPATDFRMPGKMEEVPEWYFFKTLQIGKRRPGRFILNGSLTATDVPASKIPWETLLYLVECAILYQPFSWSRWKAERIAFYTQKGSG